MSAYELDLETAEGNSGGSEVTMNYVEVIETTTTMAATCGSLSMVASRSLFSFWELVMKTR
jgi:hypothetical protein